MSVFHKTPELIFEEQTSKPVVLSKVEVTNSEPFSENYLSSLLSPVLKSSQYTVESLNDSIKDAINNLVLSKNETLQHAKTILKYDNEGNKLIIDLPQSNFKSSKTSFTTYTDNYGPGIVLNYGDNNLRGNGETLVGSVGINADLTKSFGNLLFSTPYNKFANNNLIFDGSFTKFENILNSSVTMGLDHNSFFLKNNVISLFQGFNVVQNRAGENINGKASILSSVKLSNVNFNGAFPNNGSQYSLSSEFSKLSSEKNPRDFWKLIFNTDSFFSFANNVFTFQRSSTFGYLHNFTNKEIFEQDKLPIDVIHPTFFPLQNPLFMNLNTKIDDPLSMSHTFRLLSKLPIFHKAQEDSNSILRFQIYLNTLKTGKTFSDLKVPPFQDIHNNIVNGDVQAAVDSFLSRNSVYAGCGLLFRSPFASADLGYGVPLSNEYSAGYKPGLQFNIAISMA